MKFEDVYGSWRRRRLSQSETAEILGMNERPFRRWRDGYEDWAAAAYLKQCAGRPKEAEPVAMAA